MSKSINPLLSLENPGKVFDILVHSVAFADRAELDGNYVEVTTREGFLKAHEISSYSFTALAKAAVTNA